MTAIKSKQDTSPRLTKQANEIISKWKKRYGGLNKSEAILRVQKELHEYQVRYGSLEEPYKY